MCLHFLFFGHNNYVTRRHMYHWFNRHMKLGLKEPIVERDWKPLTEDECTVWDDNHPVPEAGVPHEFKLLKAIDQDSSQQIAEALSHLKTKSKRSALHGAALKAIVGQGLSSMKDISREKVGKFERDGYLEFTDILRYESAQEEIPVASFYPTTKPWSGTVVIWVDGEGKSGMAVTVSPTLKSP